MKFLTRALSALLCAFLLAPSIAEAGFRIQSGRLVDNNGTPFVMRGVAYPFTWFTGRYPTQTQQDLTNIANLRFNTVRIVLSTGTGGGLRSTGAQLANLIQWCKDRRMIAVLEVHTSTGWGDNWSPQHHGCRELLAQLGHLQCGPRPGELRHHQHRQRAVRQQLDWQLRQRHDRGDPEPAQRRIHAQSHDRRGELGPGLDQHDARQRGADLAMRIRSAT